MKSLTLMIGACIVILLLGSVLAGINAFIMADRIEPYNITTGANVTATTITLAQKLFSNDTINVEVASNLTADAPIPQTYTTASRALVISGLVESESRRLTLTYKVDALSFFPAVGIAAKFWPIFIVLGVIGLVVAAVYNATRRGED